MLKKQIIPIVRAFQSALPRGERRTRSYNPTACKQFQSALPRGERQQIGGSLDEDRNVSIHAPARGATVSLVTRDSAHKHFNPRSREGSDTFGERSNGSSSIISIRAPARGATIRDACFHSHCLISIRAPARGATVRSGKISNRYGISIRAPARGATQSIDYTAMYEQFQSALPRGERRQGLEPWTP